CLRDPARRGGTRTNGAARGTAPARAGGIDGMKVQRIVAAGLLCAAGMGLSGSGLAADASAETPAALVWEPLIVFPEAQGRPLVRPLNAPRTVRVEYGRELDQTG